MNAYVSDKGSGKKERFGGKAEIKVIKTWATDIKIV